MRTGLKSPGILRRCRNHSWLTGIPGTSRLLKVAGLDFSSRGHVHTALPARSAAFKSPCRQSSPGKNPSKDGRQEQFLTPVEDSAINKDLWPQAQGHKTSLPLLSRHILNITWRLGLFKNSLVLGAPGWLCRLSVQLLLRS